MDLRGYSPQTIVAGTLIGGTLAAAVTYAFLTSRNGEEASSSRLVPGLANQGNTCYMNALLQGLASCPSFVGWLKSLKPQDIGIQGGFVDHLSNLLHLLNEPTGSTLTAQSIVESLKAHGWSITVGVEHDLYELFNVFVTTWEDELKSSRRILMNQSIENCHSSSSEDDEDVVVESTSLRGSPSIIRKLMSFQRCASMARIDASLRSPCVGLTATEYRCCNTNCGYRTVKYESFTVLTLAIPNSQMGTSTNTESLLRRFFCSEIIRDAICDKCRASDRKQQGFLKKHGIVKLPQTLMIRIERVGMLPNGSMKLSEHVHFGECLSLQDVCFRKNPKINQKSYEESSLHWQLPDGTSRVVGGAEETRSRRSPIHPSQAAIFGDLASNYALIDGGSFVAERREAQKYAYQLRAVSEHRGGPYSGHFVTYRRASAPNHHTWYYTSDAQVTRVPYSHVAACQSYMLFYERVKPHRLYERM
ncbi:Ubiquitin carboxyl-terminal hydrolase [Caenorhabditis elegans]|uniref:Ubiquitin carboxyl-terminal hydrolase n=1 Tax=Caenorhabditis elegans TaxID=6239 RepID=Q9BKQ6_CAEEL|nr:Ubiquitin carboxyl-terminal hydrolase [Caenorhabditis elegans]CCD73027.1 Ubiquitin carboxyl-terminal hydrolase [Caenorhabditis elegans]|eukprot:NP_497422.3 Ubiquitin carboxyl-terminal hydrolase [Caenorhabditis elegans]